MSHPTMPTPLCAIAIAVAAAAALTACGGGDAASSDLQAEIDAAFPYVANQPIDVTYVCGRRNSRLTYHFDLDADGAFTVFFETDTYQQVSFGGRYTHANGVIRLVALNNNILPLDESSTRIVPHLGLVGEFETPAMTCGAVAHGYNDPARAGWKSYGCPLIHRGPESDEENAFEFDDASSPFAYTFTGGVFRQRDVNVYRAGSPTVWRGYGIYRRVGDRFYADFGGQFPDHNLLKGRFENGDAQIVVDQLEPGAGACGRR
jgi:hypothetical protein